MYNTYPCSNCMYAPSCYIGNTYNAYNDYQYYDYNLDFYRNYNEESAPFENEKEYELEADDIQSFEGNSSMRLKDNGPQPFVVNINEAAKQNKNFRTAIWTGPHLQVTLMSINVGDDIGLEIHPNIDQFIRIEEGQGLVQMGKSRDNLDFQASAFDDFAIMIPAGTWHNIINTGNKPLKVYAIYAPPQHPFGTIHKTKEDAEKSHN